MSFDGTQISKMIVQAFHQKLMDRISSDVLIVGAGPSGLTAAVYLARQGFKVTLVEKRLAPGGGLWGGGMGMNEVVVQHEAIPILEDLGVRFHPPKGTLHQVSCIELASALCLQAVQSGAVLFNLMAAEDVQVSEGRVRGVVVNRPAFLGTLPVDPIVLEAGQVVDSTGHEAAVVRTLCKGGRRLADNLGGQVSGEGPLDAEKGESFVVQNTRELYPGLWVSGMAVCAAFGGPRMGPIFGGMLRSGKRIADLLAARLVKPSDGEPTLPTTGRGKS